ncbi:MAG: adenosylcobinamide-GDP ribazoletransferase [Candidatus Helarchaeota archaeon]|nr:adenosylcobinamide-GDP ribazoletransferase [Candidatus Helarchaeota archaeon]
MKIFKGFRNTFAFLTKIPVGMDIESMDDIARYSWLFPIVGMIIGIIPGVIGFILLLLLPKSLIGPIILGLILLLTGLHHTDGLLDFGDGIMAHGTPERKLEIMHDVNTGTGGIVLGIVILLTTAVSYSYLNIFMIFGVIIAEISAKLGMLEVASFSKTTAKGSKMAEPFVRLTKPHYFFLSFVITIILFFFLNYGIRLTIYLFWGIWYFSYFEFLIQLLIILAGSIIPSLFIYGIAKRNFKGMSGDTFGAINDICRMSTLVLLVILIRARILVY